MEYRVLNASPEIMYVSTDVLNNRIDAHHYRPRFLDAATKVLTIKNSRPSVLMKATHKIGQPADIRKFSQSGKPILNAKNVRPLCVNDDDCPLVELDVATNHKKQTLNGSEVLIVRTGAKCGDVGWVPDRYSGYLVNSHVIPIRAKGDLQSTFLAAYLSSTLGQMLLDREMTGAAQRQVSVASLNSTIVPLPDESIQKFIGNKITLSEKCRDEAEMLVVNATKVLADELGDEPSAILENVVQEGIFKNGGFSVVVDPDLIRNRLDPIGYHPELLEIQKTFHRQKPKYQRLRRLAKISTNARSRVNSSCSYFVSVLHVDNKGYLDSQAASAYYPESPGREAKPADILVSCINPAANRIAVCDDMKGSIACSPEFAILESKELPPHYLTFVLRSDLVYRQMIHLGKGTSSSRRRIDEEELLDLEIPVVSRADEIATLIKKRQKLISRSFQLTAEAKSDVEALIEGELDTDAIMSGKLKAPTWEDIERELEGIYS